MHEITYLCIFVTAGLRGNWISEVRLRGACLYMQFKGHIYTGICNSNSKGSIVMTEGVVPSKAYYRECHCTCMYMYMYMYTVPGVSKGDVEMGGVAGCRISRHGTGISFSLLSDIRTGCKTRGELRGHGG